MGTSNGARISPSHSSRPPAPPSLVLEAQRDDDGQLPILPPVYDIKLGPGLNRIELECVAVAEGALGAGTLAGKGGLEMEKFTVFANLLRL